jgi:hypothetical protein
MVQLSRTLRLLRVMRRQSEASAGRWEAGRSWQRRLSARLSLRARLRRVLVAAILVIVSAALLAYSLDYVVFRIRTATNRNAYGSVTVNHYYAVLQKNGKTQFIFDPPQAQTCVNALFPHAGWLPCWYLSRHPDQRTDI